MKTQVAASVLAILGGATALLVPSTSNAGNVGYFKNEGGCTGFVGDPSAAITAAGHTPVAIASLNAASLAPLDGLADAFSSTTTGCRAAAEGTLRG